MGDHPTQINKTCLLGDFVCAFYLKMQVINEFFIYFLRLIESLWYLLSQRSTGLLGVYIIRFL